MNARQHLKYATAKKERPLRVACTAISLYVPPGSGDPVKAYSASRTCNIAELLKIVCAVDHTSCALQLFCDDHHKNAAHAQRKRAAPRTRVAGPNLSCHEKGSTIPGRTRNYVEEFICRVWSITDKATTEVALSRERPFGYPAASPFLHYGASRFKFLCLALHGSSPKYATRGVIGPAKLTALNRAG